MELQITREDNYRNKMFRLGKKKKEHAGFI